LAKFFFIATSMILGCAGTAAAQDITAKPVQTRPLASASAMTLRPGINLAEQSPGPDEGRVEVKILGGGKVKFLGGACAASPADPINTCARNTKLNSAVQLIAEPLNGYRFAGWAGRCASSNAQKQCTLAVADTLVSASAAFVKNAAPMVALSLRYEVPSMQGLRITLKPDTELTCTASGGANPGWGKAYDCTAEFEEGATVAIKAEDWFAGGSPIDPKRWGGACQDAATSICTLKIDQPKAVSIAMYH